MNLSQITRDGVLKAVAEFDRLGRERFLKKYGYGPSSKWFLEYGGRRYDSKAIVGVAYGFDHSDKGPAAHEDFSGGEHTVVRCLQNLEFTVVSIAGNVRELLDRILSDHVNFRSQDFAGNSLWPLMKELAEQIDIAGGFGSRDITVKPSVGQGNWAEIPWISMLDPRETTSTQQGFYPVYLFRADMSGVYLAFGQGVTKLIQEHGRVGARSFMQASADTLLSKIDIPDGFTADMRIDLRGQTSAAKDYVDAVVFHRFYPADDLPDNVDLVNDLRGVSEIYEQHVLETNEQPSEWDEFFRWARYIANHPEFDDVERKYKLEIQEELQEVLTAFHAGSEDWIDLLQAVVRSADQNLVSHYVHVPFLEWAHGHPVEAATAIRELWADGSIDIEQRIRSFLLVVPSDVVKGSGSRLNMTAFLAMGMDATKYPPYRVTPFRRLFKACGYEVLVSDGDEADDYGTALNFLDTMIEEGIERGLELRDRLEAQSIAWSFFDTSGFFEKFIPDDEREGFHAYKLRTGLATKKSIDELIEDADSEQVGEAFRQLVHAAESVEGVFLRPYINTVMFTPAQHHGLTLGAVTVVKGKGLELGVSPTKLYQYFPRVAPDVLNELKEYLGVEVESGKWIHVLVTPEDWGEKIKPFLALFDQLSGTSPLPPPPRTIDDLMDELVDETLWSEARLRSILTAAQKSPVILSGPPGTSKTWVAQRLAKCLAGGDASFFRTVQFHPSYGYEEFMEGLRPEVDDNEMLTFKVRPGVVRQMAGEIDRESSQYHVLVIDEMNRANLPRVLGELMYLFEYRNEAIDLQYTSDFELPHQLLFIATMNTADRSTQSLDIALRRRFEIFECPPDVSILQRFYKQPGNTNEVEDLVEGFEKLNQELNARLPRHLAIGHSYFMEEAMTRQRLRDVWDRQVKPLIEEYFLDQPDLADEFLIEKYWLLNE